MCVFARARAVGAFDYYTYCAVHSSVSGEPPVFRYAAVRCGVVVLVVEVVGCQA